MAKQNFWAALMALIQLNCCWLFTCSIQGILIAVVFTMYAFIPMHVRRKTIKEMARKTFSSWATCHLQDKLDLEEQRSKRDQEVEDRKGYGGCDRGNLLRLRRNPGFGSASVVFPASSSTSDNHHERIRLFSFKDFPASACAFAPRLAKAGFFYTGERDKVRCFSCGVSHEGYQWGNRPDQTHAQISPNCPLVQGNHTANVPLLTGGSLSHETNSHGDESVSTGGQRIQFGAAPDRVASTRGENSQEVSNAFSSLAPSSFATVSPSSMVPSLLIARSRMVSDALSTTGSALMNQFRAVSPQLGDAVYPLYAMMQARRSSFPDWMGRGFVPINDLVTAGFFYAGFGCVRCFFCGICLRSSWEGGNTDLAVEHAYRSPRCEYLIVIKGIAFVNRIAYGGVAMRGQFQLLRSLQFTADPRCLNCNNHRRVIRLPCCHYLCYRCIYQNGQPGGLFRCIECNQQYSPPSVVTSRSRFSR